MSFVVAGAQIVTRAEIEALVGFDASSLEAIRRAFVWLDEDRVRMPPVMHVDVPEHDGAVDVKSAYVRDVPTLAVKIGAGFPGNRARGLPTSPAIMLALDASTGTTSAVLFDEAYLTDLRTALAGAVAAELLAPEGECRVGIIGAGVQARFQLRALRLVRRIASVTIWSRSEAHAAALADDIQGELGCPVRTSSIPELAAVSNLIVTTTPSTVPLLDAAHVQPGTHVTSVGSDLPGKRELAPELLARASYVVCDDVAQSQRLGELQGVDLASLKHAPVPLPSLVNGRIALRRAATSITIADLSGLGVQDTAIAHELLERLAADTRARRPGHGEPGVNA